MEFFNQMVNPSEKFDIHRFEHRIVARGGKLDIGLSEMELEQAQLFAGARFPSDLIALLSTALPIGGEFPNWRRLDSHLQQQLDWPLEGLLFDLEHNDLWLPSWGECPADLRAQQEKFRVIFSQAPKLIPIYGHRYLPAFPAKPTTPVLSVYQADIIYYGTSLRSYFNETFGDGSEIDSKSEPNTTYAKIPFWSDLIY